MLRCLRYQVDHAEGAIVKLGVDREGGKEDNKPR